MRFNKPKNPIDYKNSDNNIKELILEVIKDVGTVKGYHGYLEDKFTDYKLKKFQISKRSDNWLGKGLYFFQDGPYFAKGWAKFIANYRLKNLKDKGKYNKRLKYRIMEAEIDLKNCLCFCDKPAQSLFLRVREFFEESMKNFNFIYYNYLIKYCLDNAIIETICTIARKIGIEIKSVRGAFTTGKNLFFNEGLKDMSHIQFTIRAGHMDLIKRFKIIDEGCIEIQ